MAEQTLAGPQPTHDRSDPIRVLWAIKGLGRGGAEQLLVSAARVADHDRFQYETCYVLSYKTALVEALAAQGVVVHPLQTSTSRPHRWLWPWRLRRLLRSGRYDVVHAHSPLIATAVRAAVATMPRQRPVTIYTQHNVWQSYSWPTRLVEAGTHRSDRYRFAVSPAVARSSPSRVGSSMEMLVHGVVGEDYRTQERAPAEVRADLGVPLSAPLVLTVANLRATKAYPNLLSAARIVVTERPETRFIAVGDGPLRAELEEARDRLGLSGSFHFLGSRSDVPDLLHAADIFTLPSQHEGLPISVMEAMTAGVPSVLTRVGGIPDIVQDGRDALLVSPGQPAALARALLRLIDDPELGASLAAKAQAASGEFDIKAAVDRYQRAYEDVV